MQINEEINMIKINLNQGKYSEAEKRAKNIIKNSPQNFLGWEVLGIVYFEKRQYDDAIKAYRKLIDLKKNYAPAHYSLGLVLHQAGRLEEAEISYKNAILLNPKNYQAHSNRGVILSALGKFFEAIESYKAALSHNEENPFILNNLGNAYESVGEDKKALICYNKATELDPKFSDAHYNLGIMLEKVNRDRGAIKHFKLALKAEPNLEEAKHVLSALEGITTTSAPSNYVKNLFDGYAGNFDNALVEKLEYNIPEKLSELILKKTNTKSYGSVLDLGCGKGLMGECIKKESEYPVGVDISQLMLNEAQKKNIYDILKCQDITNYLANANLRFDHIIATDVFIYLGELSKIFKYLKERNQINGYFSFSTEHSDKDKYYLKKTGRYSHSRKYIEQLCLRFNFEIKYFQLLNLRKERGSYIKGALYILAF